MMRVPSAQVYAEEEKKKSRKWERYQKTNEKVTIYAKNIVDHCLQAETLNEPFQCLQAMCIDRCQLQFNEIFIFIFFLSKKRRSTLNSNSIRHTISITLISDCRSMHTLTYISVCLLVVSNETCKNYYLLNLMLANTRGEEKERERVGVWTERFKFFTISNVFFSLLATF